MSGSMCSFSIAGVLQAIQAGMNAQLKASLQNPWLAGSVLYGVALDPT